MSDSAFYTFEDTDALLASLSSSSVPTLSPNELDTTYNSGKSSVSGYSPEEEVMFQEDNWNTGFNNDLIQPNPNPNSNPMAQQDFTNQFLDFGLNEQIEKPVFTTMNPSNAYISPRSSSSAAHSPVSDHGKETTKEAFKMKTPETHDDEDDEDDFNEDEHPASSNKKSKTTASKVGKPKKDRSSHNIIEKKYRLNINSKIIELRNAVPSLRIAAGDTEMSINDLEGLVPASKINKASVLSKATEYIKHLEMKNTNLMNENAHLKQLLGSFSPHQQQMFVQQQQQQPLPQQQTPFQNFQPATDFNGQPLNMISQQQPPHYQMGVPGKVLMGGLATMVGQNLFNGGDYDFRGLSAFPILSTPQFQLFINIVKFFFVAFSFCYVFVPGLFNTTTETSKDKKQSNVSLSAWYTLLKEITANKVGALPLKEASDDEILRIMNKELLASTKTCCFSSLLFLFIKLQTYKPSFEVSFAKLTLAKMLLSYSDLSKYFSLHQIIESSLAEISEQKVSTNYLRYFHKEFKTKSAERSEAHKRLLNLAVGLPINTNCKRGIEDQGYVLTLKDERVIYDYKSLLVSIRANELFREVLLEHIDLTFNKTKHAKLDEEEYREVKQDIWNKLILSEHLAPEKSIVDIRIQLFKSVLNEKYLGFVLQTLDQESKALVINEKFQKGQSKNTEADDVQEDEEITDSDLETEDEDDNGLELAQTSNLDPKFEKLLSQDLFNALTSSCILKFIKNGQKPHSINLLKYLRSNKSQITLLSFISMFRLLEKLPQEWVEGQKEYVVIENLTNQLRLWIGSKANLNFDDLSDSGLKLKREISDKLVNVNKALISSSDE